MPNGIATETPVAKKRLSSSPSSQDVPFERVEFQAPPGFLARLDRVRKKRGLSRSAYMRQAILLLMDRDEADQEQQEE